MDFTLKTYTTLLKSLQVKGSQFIPVREYLKYSKLTAHNSPLIILRHDVDRLPSNALKMANIENDMGIKSTFYFRIVKPAFEPEIIKKIAKMGHEIGYHYEDLTLSKGLVPKAIQLFEQNLKKLRQIAEVKTICMHGCPLSKWDNRAIWKEIDYKNYGIILEPYFDIDYSEYFYITDTGRKWNKKDVNIRDKVNSGFNIPIKNTKHLFSLIENNTLPPKMIINTHPHRWFNPGFMWYQELIFQNMKNIVKIGLNFIRK